MQMGEVPLGQSGYPDEISKQSDMKTSNLRKFGTSGKIEIEEFGGEYIGNIKEAILEEIKTPNANIDKIIKVMFAQNKLGFDDKLELLGAILKFRKQMENGIQVVINLINNVKKTIKATSLTTGEKFRQIFLEVFDLGDIDNPENLQKKILDRLSIV